MSKMSRKLHEQRLHEDAERSFTPEGIGRAPVAPHADPGAAIVAPTLAQRRLMRAMAIGFDARGYSVNGVRYARLSDAFDQAVCVASR